MPRGTNKNPNRVPDLLTKVLPKAVSALASKPWQEGLGTRQITSLRPRPLRSIAQRLVDSLNTYAL